jgi:hypothetical protein
MEQMLAFEERQAEVENKTKGKKPNTTYRVTGERVGNHKMP